MLERLGVPFTVRAADVQEIEHGDPAQVVVENARRKASAVRDPGAREAVLGCDTVVALPGAIYGKPADEHAARQMLRSLSGRTHEVLSGLVLLLPAGDCADRGDERTAVARTEVSFRLLEDELLDWYLATGEWRGRAGGYAIQGAGAALVRAVTGDYENVVGLPLASLLDLYPQLLTG
ncbi:MAG: maf [Solirubrobacterales bacterium]|jgi:septum formation protein|nr:maf [Solirubrobacterales bacterium]